MAEPRAAVTMADELPFDVLVCAAARIAGLPLITRAAESRAAGVVPVIR